MKNTLTPKDLLQLNPLILDGKDHQYAERYALLYHELLSSSNCSVLVPFYVADIKNALNLLPFKEKKKIYTAFGLAGGTINYLKDLKHNDIALQNLLMDVEQIMLKLRALKYMYIYAPRVREYIDLAAKKVWDPEGKYSNLTKAKYVGLYYVFLVNYYKFPLEDFKDLGEKLSTENRNYILPYFIVEAYNTLFCKFSDGDIIIPMIDAFLNSIDSKLRKTILEYSQLALDIYQYKTVASIRILKEELFPSGRWKAGIDFFRVSGIKRLSITQFKNGISAYKKYTTNKEMIKTSTEKVEYSSETKVIQEYNFHKDFSISDTQELMAYENLFKFLSTQMPNLPLGKRKIPFCESSLVK